MATLKPLSSTNTKQYVKDHRSGTMRHDPDNVLDGDIEDLIWSGLEWRAEQRVQGT